MTEFYASAELYDLLHGDDAADISFYVEEAERAEPPVLELACGTGRVLIPVAEAGVPVWGVDVTPAMLAQAEKKVAALPAEVRQRITLRQGDMRDFDLDQRFGLVYIPARSFLHLMTVEDQLAALRNMRNHLRPGGRLALNFFQPSIPTIAAHLRKGGSALQPLDLEGTDPETGQRTVGWETREYLPATQVIRNNWIFDVLDADGRMVDRYYRSLTLRWIYRYEFEHLLARTGFELEALYGDLERDPVTESSTELVWVARRGG